MADNDSPDDELRALYRGLPREEPPPAIDAAVLAAGRRSVAKRPDDWKVPLSLAAVLVLSVAVTLRVNDEQPEIRAIQPPPPVVAQVPQAPAVKPEPRADVPVESPAPQPKAQARPQPAPPREMAKTAPRPREIAKSEAALPAKEESVIASAPAPALPPQADAAAQSAAGLAAPDARAERAAPRAARSRADAPSLASAAPLSPEELATYIRAEIAKWGRVIKSSGAKVD